METMKRLIDANALVAKCKKIAETEWNKHAAPISWSDAYYGFIDDIEELPPVDGVEVVHGHWIDRIDNNTQMHECSECGARVVKQLYEDENPNLFCYHCGAKMDGERKTDERKAD